MLSILGRRVARAAAQALAGAAPPPSAPLAGGQAAPAAAAAAAAAADAQAAAAAAAAAACSSSGRRGIATSRHAADLREFFDPPDAKDVTFGRPWRAYELRLKSWDDLHRLWHVCLKERNLTATAMTWERGPSADAQRREEFAKRYKKVKKTMNRIKQVLSERALREANPVRRAKLRQAIHLM